MDLPEWLAKHRISSVLAFLLSVGGLWSLVSERALIPALTESIGIDLTISAPMSWYLSVALLIAGPVLMAVIWLKSGTEREVVKFVLKERAEPFEVRQSDNPNITVAKLGVLNLTDKLIQNCYVRIEKVEQSTPSSLWNIFDKARILVEEPKKQTISIGAHDTEFVPIARLDKINSDMTGIELLCYSTEGRMALDPKQMHTLTVRASTEIGQPIERKYKLWVDELKQLRFREISE